MSNIVPVSDMLVMADAIVKSGFYGFKTKEQALAVMLVAQAEQKHPATVLQEYDIIQNRPALKSQAMLARFQLSGGKVQWDEMSPKRCSGTFSHPNGGSLTVEWTIDMAKQAGVFREGSGWTKYPEDMLAARVISRAVRKVYPACILGHYAVEEVVDFEPKGKPKDMGTAERVDVQPVIVEEPDGAFPLYVPGNDKPYNRLHVEDEWIAAYSGLVARIASSGKLTDAEKASKYLALQEANKEVVEGFSSIYKVKLKGEIVKAGGQTNPKPSQSLSDMDSLQSDPEFSTT